MQTYRDFMFISSRDDITSAKAMLKAKAEAVVRGTPFTKEPVFCVRGLDTLPEHVVTMEWMFTRAEEKVDPHALGAEFAAWVASTGKM